MFLICGEVLLDLVQAGPRVRVAGGIGGSPANVAIGLARLEQPVHFVCQISNDGFGDAIAACLAAEGVRLVNSKRMSEPTPLAIVNLGADGVPKYEFRGLADTPAPHMPPVLPDAVRVIHVGSVAAALGPSAVAIEALVVKHRARCLISYDPNVRPSIEPDVAVWRHRVEAMAAHAHVIKVSAEDLAFLWPRETAESVAERWLAGGAKLVVVTHGPEGATARTRHLSIALPGWKIIVADTVGAGDAFQAALLFACARAQLTVAEAYDVVSPETLRDVVATAICAGAFACTRPGADMPLLAQLLEACIEGGSNQSRS